MTATVSRKITARSAQCVLSQTVTGIPPFCASDYTGRVCCLQEGDFRRLFFRERKNRERGKAHLTVYPEMFI